MKEIIKTNKYKIGDFYNVVRELYKEDGVYKIKTHISESDKCKKIRKEQNIAPLNEQETEFVVSEQEAQDFIIGII